MSAPLAARIAAAALLLTGPSLAIAQRPSSPIPAFELRVPSGQFIGTGAQRDQVRDGQATAAQFAVRVRPHVAITGTFAWARSRDVARSDAPKLDIFTSDLGVELHSARWLRGSRLSFGSFAGLGAGARSYNYRKLDVAATHNLAGYAAVGGDVRMGPLGLRLEARDYATGFRPLLGGGVSRARNDVMVMAAITLHLRRGASE